jgi:hypothetical protein
MFNLLSCFRCSFRKLEAYATTKSTARKGERGAFGKKRCGGGDGEIEEAPHGREERDEIYHRILPAFAVKDHLLANGGRQPIGALSLRALLRPSADFTNNCS